MIEKRGRPKETPVGPSPRKSVRTFEDELMIETWIYDLDKFPNGPISVEIKYKPGAINAIKQYAKDAKQEKKAARQMKKINNKQL